MSSSNGHSQWLVVAFVSAATVLVGCARRPPPEVSKRISELSSANPAVRRHAAERLCHLKSAAGYEAFVQALGDDDAEVRMWAAWGLGALGDSRAVGVLACRLTDRYEAVRRAAVSALGMIGTPECREILFLALRDPGGRVAVSAALTVARFKDEATAQRLADLALSCEDQDVRLWATVALGEMAAAFCEPHLLRIARSAEGQNVRLAALRGLAKIASPTTVEFLRSVAFDHSAGEQLRAGAVSAMAESGRKVYAGILLELLHRTDPPGVSWIASALEDKRAVPRLCELLDSPRHEVGRASIAAALGRIGDERAVPALCRVLDDKDWSVCRAAVTALGQIKSRRALDLLVRAYVTRKHVGRTLRRAFCDTFVSIDKAAAGDRLLKLLDDEEFTVRGRAAEALGLLRFEPAIPRLRRALDDENWTVRCAAALAIGRLGDRRSFDKLAKMARHRNPSERVAASTSFQYLRDERAIPILIWMAQAERDPSHAQWALRELVGPAVGLAGREWRKWWEEEGRARYGTRK